MKLGFDIDEVVCDLTKYLSMYLKEQYGLKWSLDDWCKYNLSACDYSGCGNEKLNKEIAADLWQKSLDFGFLGQCPPVDGAIKALQGFKKGGHTLHYITTRPKKKEHLTIEWLRMNNIPFDSVHHVGLGGEKGFIGRSLNLDFFMDDLERNLRSMLRYKQRWKKGLVLLDKPWNRDSHFVKLSNWNQVIRHLGIHNR